MFDFTDPQFQLFFLIVFFIFGTLFGSFANVIILRLPKNLSIVTPRSHCYSCQNPLKWFDNIPVFAWFFLRGKCRQCQAPFSFRYPFVEILMGLSFSAAFYFLGWSWFLLEIILFLFALIVASFIDIDHFILPDTITLSGIVIGLLGALLNPERSFLDAFLGCFLGGGFLWAVAYFYFVFRKEEGMGGGDIKLLAWMGAVLGWKAIPFIILSSSVVGALIGGFLAIRSTKGMKTVIPFGPYLAFGAVLYLFAGEELSNIYIQFFIPGLY